MTPPLAATAAATRTLARAYATATATPTAAAAAAAAAAITARSYVPPNLAVSAGRGSALATPTGTPSGGIDDSAAQLPRLVRLYKGLPKGPAPYPATEVRDGPLAGYRNKHFQPGRETGAPLLHVILIIFGIGYTMAYTSHLSHHKNKEHH
ncbi:hypothetical protein RI367_002933 [Sorochytrium milnesiophthora]